jgi:hypothetical protein
MKLRVIMLSEISQTSLACFHSYVESREKWKYNTTGSLGSKYCYMNYQNICIWKCHNNTYLFWIDICAKKIKSERKEKNHPFHHSPPYPLPHSSNSFNRSHFSIFIYEYIIFLPYFPSYILSWYLPPPSHWYQPLDRTWFMFLSSFFEGEKKDIFVCLRYLYKVFHYAISMYICILSQIG